MIPRKIKLSNWMEENFLRTRCDQEIVVVENVAISLLDQLDTEHLSFLSCY